MKELFFPSHKFPYKIYWKERVKNLVRYFFTIRFLEEILISKLASDNKLKWRRLIPPSYLYKPKSVREVNRNGLNFELDISMFLDHSIFFDLIGDDLAMKCLYKNIKPDFNILDIGANIGYQSLMFAKLCPDGKVYSFEPDSQNFEVLKKNILLNSFKNIVIFKKALGAKNGTVTLYKYAFWNPGMNRILTEKPSVEHKSEPLTIVTLDEIIDNEQIEKVDLIKIDVEGFEKFVLEGAQNTIKKWSPILFIELVESNLKQQGLSCESLIEYIKNMGYLIFDAQTMLPIEALKEKYNTDMLCFKS